MGRVHVNRFFLFSKQIKQQGADTGFANCARDELIARTVTAAARTVSKQNHALSAVRNAQVSLELHVAGTNVNVFRLRDRCFGNLTHDFSFYFIFSSMISSSKTSSSAPCPLPFELLINRSRLPVSCWLLFYRTYRFSGFLL